MADSVKIRIDGDPTGFEKSMKGIQASAEKAAKAAAASIAAITAGLGVATKAGMDFEQQMSAVQSISRASASDMAILSEKAKKLGMDTQFSATQAGQAFEYMALAGWKTGQMLEGVSGIMDLAAASGENLAMTADIVTDGLTAFRMGAEDAGKFADILAATASNANTNVAMLGESFKYVGPVAGGLGYNINDIALALGLMANAGVKASMAGTSLTAMISKLQKPTGDAKKVMQQLGLSIIDSNGKMKDFRTILEDVRKAFLRLAPAQRGAAATTLFGLESLKGVMAIVNATDQDFKKLAASIDNATGSAEEMAEIRLDNLRGQITLLGSSLESLSLEIYEYMDEPLKEAVKGAIVELNNLTKNVKGGELSAGMQQIAEAFAGLVSSMLQFSVNVLPDLINGLKLIIDNSDKIAAAITGIVAAMITFKTVATITAIIEGFVNLTKAIKTAGVAQGILNTLMIRNPIGLALSLMAGLVAAAIVLRDTNDDVKESFDDAFIFGAQAITGVIWGIQTLAKYAGNAADIISGRLKQSIDSIKDPKFLLTGGILGGEQAAREYEINVAAKLNWDIPPMPQLFTPEQLGIKNIEKANSGLSELRFGIEAAHAARNGIVGPNMIERLLGNVKEAIQDFPIITNALNQLAEAAGQIKPPEKPKEDATAGIALIDESAQKAANAIRSVEKQIAALSTSRTYFDLLKEGVDDITQSLKEAGVASSAIESLKGKFAAAFEAKSMKEASDYLRQLNLELANMTGNAQLAAQITLDQKISEISEKIRQLVPNADEANRKIAELTKQFTEASEIQTRRTMIEKQLEALEQIKHSSPGAVDAIKGLRAEYERLALVNIENLGLPENLKNEIIEYRQKMAELGDTIEAGMYKSANAFVAEWTDATKTGEKLFGTMLSGVQQLGDMAIDSIFDGAEFRVDQLFKNIGKMLLQLAMNQIIASLLKPEGLLGFLGLFHTGGIVGADVGGPPRLMNYSVLNSAPRYHSGLAPNEFPAILQRGEGVFTKNQMAALGFMAARGGGGGDVTINIETINQSSGATTRTTAERGSNGEINVKTMVADAVASNIGGGGVVSAAIESSFGARRISYSR